MKLVCFTYAGGTAAFFEEIERELSGIELIKPEYSGHGTRHKEEFYSDFESLADDMFEKVKDSFTLDYALFGYSMGSITAVEVLKRVLDRGFRKPRHLFLAAHEPHTKSELRGFSSDEMDEWVKKRTIEFGDVPEKLINNKVFWRTYLPLYRADYSVIGSYEFERLSLNTDIPVTVFYSESDTPLTEMKKWEKYFKGSVNYKKYDGSHFFIRDHYKEIAEVIKSRILYV